MTEQEMRIAVAESVGTKGGWYCGHCRETVACTAVTFDERHEKCGNAVHEDSPNYPQDLNAMRDVENTLTGADIVIYTKHLIELTGSTPEPWTKGCLVLYGVACMNFACATALQRCEAYLRVKGLWK